MYTKKLTPPEANRSARFFLLSISSLSTEGGDRALFRPVGAAASVAVLAALLEDFGMPKRAARASILATSYWIRTVNGGLLVVDETVHTSAERF